MIKKDVAAVRTFIWKKKKKGRKRGVLLASTDYLCCAALANPLAL